MAQASSSFALRARILSALGLASSALFAYSIAACSGKVVVDAPDDGVGGAGGNTSTTSDSSSADVSAVSTGTGDPPPPAGCAEPLPSGAEYRYLCLPGSIGESCPTVTEAIPKLMEQVIGTQECIGSGTCCGPTNTGCTAPPSNGNECCYSIGIYFEICEGRPLLAGDEALTAEPSRRGDWQDERMPRPSLSGLDEASRHVLAAHFVKAGLFEHASVASFARFALELLSVGAPASLVSSAQEAMADEIRHAKICFGLASAYAGEELGPSALRMQNVSPRQTILEIAVSTALEGCINETASALFALEESLRATDPAVKAALSSIAEDEARHAELAWRTVAWALREGGSDIEQALRSTFAAARCGAIEWPETPPGDSDKLAVFGLLSATEKRALFHRAMLEVVAPCAASMLAEAGVQSGDLFELSSAAS